ncbi:MAG: hypothetical protein HY202_08500 [Nitrospirae bacterium]|nr:hypothetical protein [Nitrospirota bacterium]
MKFKSLSYFYSCFILLVLFISGGCGGSNSSGSAPDITSQIHGVANDAIISGGTVSVYQYESGQKGAVLGTAKTDFQGLFSLSISSYWGPVLFEIKGGSYVDDATGNIIYLAPDQYLSAAKNINPGENIGNLAITPLTTIASALAKSYMNQGAIVSSSIDTANNTISTLYGFDILGTTPVNLTLAKVSFSPQSAYGLLLAGISQMASQISSSNGIGAGSLSSIQLADMMATDAMDGVLDGKQSGQQISSGTYLLDSYSYRTKLCQASALFLSSTRNYSGLIWNDVIIYLNPIASYMSLLFPPNDTPKPIDVTPPSINLVFNASSYWIFSITTQATDDISGIASLTLTPSTTAISPVQGLPGMTSTATVLFDFTKLPDGQYFLTVTAKDQAGNLYKITSNVYTNNYNYCLSTGSCRFIR